jgi:hypothetical protein
MSITRENEIASVFWVSGCRIEGRGQYVNKRCRFAAKRIDGIAQSIIIRTLIGYLQRRRCLLAMAFRLVCHQSQRVRPTRVYLQRLLHRLAQCLESNHGLCFVDLTPLPRSTRANLDGGDGNCSVTSYVCDSHDFVITPPLCRASSRARRLHVSFGCPKS